ncbi:hypothetical protein [Streptomyces sp. NBC_01750]|uniref:hypothetical protein n=1 Tax=Streptomyces sp. NBC_01750 TaxID=2975928 RepID=UPI002DD7A075|nr:hypothetical protein [Streptomyces sp. NBC_01750]WSD38132.1 hypothetical protein OG966_40230 [Streptomyces sp. NBC_01750]
MNERTSRLGHRPAAPSADVPPFLTVHTTVVILTALFIGCVVGGLTFLSGSPLAASVLAGLTGVGVSVPVLRSLIR